MRLGGAKDWRRLGLKWYLDPEKREVCSEANSFQRRQPRPRFIFGQCREKSCLIYHADIHLMITILISRMSAIGWR
jgi:hypothetical protein